VKINVVLIEPEIPPNTGNISRTCAAVGAALHLVKPLGFSIEDKYLKRAGLDYWDSLELHIHESFEELQSKYPKELFFYSTTKAGKLYTQIKYPDGCFLVFGKETKGIDEKLLHANLDRCIRIPMKDKIRSLNLSNSAAIVIYEALRQNGFKDMQKEGSFGTYER
jgi:tRNA (cytidine/uridine-2'-O-)-methyltransferase